MQGPWGTERPRCRGGIREEDGESGHEPSHYGFPEGIYGAGIETCQTREYWLSFPVAVRPETSRFQHRRLVVWCYSNLDKSKNCSEFRFATGSHAVVRRKFGE